MAARPNAREGESLARDGRGAGERAGQIAGEQAALRRVAVLVARAVPREEIFAAVAAEVGRVLEADFTYLGRYDPDAEATILAAWATTGAESPIRVGDRIELTGRNLHSLVFQTHRPSLINDYANASGPSAAAGRAAGTRSVVGVPVSVAGLARDARSRLAPKIGRAVAGFANTFSSLRTGFGAGRSRPGMDAA